MRKFNSSLVRGLLLKGHAYKLEQGAETLLQELDVGLTGYIQYKTKHEGSPADYAAWRQAIIQRVKEKLDADSLYPAGDMGQKEVKALQEHLVFLKEDRAPHVVVAMCKYRYMYERERYLYDGHTFQETTEEAESIAQRHSEYHESKGLKPNMHLPYIYGIWKSAKRSLRWISGVRKDKEERGSKEKPEGTIAGVGKELVRLLTHVMHALRNKDMHQRMQGKPKACWFIESVEEVAQPLRFEAPEVAKAISTVTMTDFVTMYPSFDQQLLKERLRDAITEAWQWEENKTDDGKNLRARRDGWVKLTDEEATRPQLGTWTKEEVLDMVSFVVDNGYIKRGNAILRQVKGFGMGLACAPQIANLGCYPVERDFAASKSPADVEHNYRFIDDILSLTGCIPSAEQYGMRYKQTKPKEGELVYLGMVLLWVASGNTTKFITGMHFRDAVYPITIRRYPGAGSMITDSQRMGVVTGQFIRAQRLCSTMKTFKEAVQNVVLASMRRGYFRHELDRMWGRFLANWWKAEEVRRGELRSWFRKMTQWVKKQVKKERMGHSTEKLQSKQNPPAGTCPTSTPPGTSVAGEPHVTRKRERVPKKDSTTWRATGDGSCLFYCVAMTNDPVAASQLRRQLAEYTVRFWDKKPPGFDITVGQVLTALGWQKDQYLAAVVTNEHYAEEPELALLSQMLGVTLRVFLEDGDAWQECIQYGSRGTLRRLAFNPSAKHYNVLQTSDEGGRGRPETALQPSRAKRIETLSAMGRASRRNRRIEGVDLSRLQEVVADEDVDLLLSLAGEGCTTEQKDAIVRILTGRAPWQVLGVQAFTPREECIKAYKVLSLLVHPDKCKHPRSSEAFQKVGDAVGWARDKNAWHAAQTARLWSGLRAQRFDRWVARGGNLKALQKAEEVDRELGWAEESWLRIQMEEEMQRQGVSIAHEEAKAILANSRKQRTRTQTQHYQSEHEEQREQQMRQKARESKQHTREKEPPTGGGEEESHNWKEGERMGEAKQPGPPWQRERRWQGAGGRCPWGQERRQPGHALQAQQAWGGGQPHQKWQQPATNRFSKDAEGWTTVRGTATTSTRTPSHPPRKRTQYDSHPSSISRSPVGGIATNVQHTHTHTYSKACWYGTRCCRGDCPYWHPTNDTGPKTKECWYANWCRRENCPYWHPDRSREPNNKACWYGKSCNSERCPYWHPGQSTNAGSTKPWRGLSMQTRAWGSPAPPTRQCKYGERCWVKNGACRFFHPQDLQRRQDWEPHHGTKGPGKGEKGRPQELRFQEDARGRGGGPLKPLHSEPAPLAVQWPRSGRGRPTVTTQSTSWKGSGKGTQAPQAGKGANDSSRKRKFPIPVQMGSDNYWEPLRYAGQKRNFALGQNQASHSATKGVHPRKTWGPALAGQAQQDRELPYPWTKNARSSHDLSKGRPFSWKDHRLCARKCGRKVQGSYV